MPRKFVAQTDVSHAQASGVKTCRSVPFTSRAWYQKLPVCPIVRQYLQSSVSIMRKATKAHEQIITLLWHRDVLLGHHA